MCAAMGDGGVAGTHVAEEGTEDRGMYFYGEHAETPAILLQIGGGVTGVTLTSSYLLFCPFACTGFSYQHPRGIDLELRMGKAPASSFCPTLE